MALINASKLVEIVRHLAENLQDRRLAELTDVRLAVSLERQRADILGMARQRLGAPDGGDFVRQLLRLARCNAVLGSSEGQSDIIGDGHRSTCLDRLRLKPWRPAWTFSLASEFPTPWFGPGFSCAGSRPRSGPSTPRPGLQETRWRSA